MKPVDPPDHNAHFGPPPGVSETQVVPIKAWVGLAGGGSMDGATLVITAWKPEPIELAALNDGKPIFLTFVACGLPPHMATTDFEMAKRPA